MDFNTIQSLQEAYREVNENLLGSLDRVARDTAGKVGETIGREKASKVPGANIPGLGDIIKGEGGRRGRNQGQQMYDKAKETVGGLLNQEYQPDAFDIVLEYLVAEGYADTNKAAIAIMANMSEEWRQSIVEAGMNPSETSAAKQQATKAAVDFFTKPRKPLPPYEAKKPRFGALTVPDFDLGSNKKGPRTPIIARDNAKTERPRPPVAEKPKAKPPVATAPPKAKPPVTTAPPKAETPKTEAPKPTETPKVETPKPKGGEVAMSKIGDKSDYSVAATAKMSDRTKTILGTKDSETGKTIRKPQFGSLSPRERQGLG